VKGGVKIGDIGIMMTQDYQAAAVVGHMTILIIEIR
jgi:hypothetical protein